MTTKEWKIELQQDFTGDTDADIRMLKNRMTDSRFRTDGAELRNAAHVLIAELYCRKT